ncbi:hypothetical protein PENTCL1PPCAC_25952, partial [Pristionchus entomophagus]
TSIYSSPPITSPISSIPPLTCDLPSSSFTSAQPIGPPLFTSHSSSPLSIPLPLPLSSFRPSSYSIPAMSSNDHRSIDSLNASARFHISSFLKCVQSAPPSLSGSHIVHCSKTRDLILRAHSVMEDNAIGDLSPSLLSALFSIHPETVRRTLHDSTNLFPPNRFPPRAPPPPKKTKKAIVERVKQKFSEETLEKLRRFIHVEYFALSLKEVNDRKEEWKDQRDEHVAISIPTVRLLLHSMNFAWVKLTGRTNIYMNEYLCRLQSNFLRKMAEIRKEGNFLIWSTDETWVHKGMRPNIDWQDLEATKNPLTFIRNGLTTGKSAQWTKGERLVIVACLSEDGFRCPLIWLTGKTDDGGDYHKEMNSEEFEKYIESVFKALVAEAKEKNLKPVLLMDNAKYHSRVLDKMPTSNDKRDVIKVWLENHGEQCPPRMRKVNLINKKLLKPQSTV